MGITLSDAILGRSLSSGTVQSIDGFNWTQFKTQTAVM